MKRIHKRETTYQCDLGIVPLLNIVSPKENYDMDYKDIIIGKIINNNEVILERHSASSRDLSSGNTRVRYDRDKQQLTVKTTPLRYSYNSYYSLMIFIFVFCLIEFKGKDFTIYCVPLGGSLFLTIAFASIVYKDFTDINFAITKQLQKEGIEYKKIE
jgi:hypothetical protein